MDSLTDSSFRQPTLDGSAPAPAAHDFIYAPRDGVMVASCSKCGLRVHMATLESEGYMLSDCVPQLSLFGGENDGS